MKTTKILSMLVLAALVTLSTRQAQAVPMQLNFSGTIEPLPQYPPSSYPADAPAGLNNGSAVNVSVTIHTENLVDSGTGFNGINHSGNGLFTDQSAIVNYSIFDGTHTYNYSSPNGVILSWTLDFADSVEFLEIETADRSIITGTYYPIGMPAGATFPDYTVEGLFQLLISTPASGVLLYFAEAPQGAYATCNPATSILKTPPLIAIQNNAGVINVQAMAAYTRATFQTATSPAGPFVAVTNSPTQVNASPGILPASDGVQGVQISITNPQGSAFYSLGTNAPAP